MSCPNRPRYVIVFYDTSKGPKMGPPEAYGEPVIKVSSCESCAVPVKAAMREKGCMPHHLPPRKGAECGKRV